MLRSWCCYSAGSMKLTLCAHCRMFHDCTSSAQAGGFAVLLLAQLCSPAAAAAPGSRGRCSRTWLLPAHACLVRLAAAGVPGSKAARQATAQAAAAAAAGCVRMVGGDCGCQARVQLPGAAWQAVGGHSCCLSACMPVEIAHKVCVAAAVPKMLPSRNTVTTCPACSFVCLA
jgi:hypothetical protein